MPQLRGQNERREAYVPKVWRGLRILIGQAFFLDRRAGERDSQKPAFVSVYRRRSHDGLLPLCSLGVAPDNKTAGPLRFLLRGRCIRDNLGVNANRYVLDFGRQQNRLAPSAPGSANTLAPRGAALSYFPSVGQHLFGSAQACRSSRRGI